MNCILHTPVRTHFDFAVLGPPKSHWQAELQFTPACLLANGFKGPLSQRIQLELAHRPLEPEQQTVIKNARIVNPVRIDDDGANQSAKFDQMMPVPAIARKTRCFDA
jgi:hypothetical protein